MLVPFEEEISGTVAFDIQGEASSQVLASGQHLETLLALESLVERSQFRTRSGFKEASGHGLNGGTPNSTTVRTRRTEPQTGDSRV